MQIPAVRLLQRVQVVGIVVLPGDLVPAVEHRNAALCQKKRVEHLVQGQGLVQLLPIVLKAGRLHAAQAGGGSAQPGIPQPGVFVIQLSPGAAVEAAPEPVVEEALVGDLLHAELFKVRIVEAPADVVVAAQIVEEGVLPGKGKHRAQLVLQQAHIVGGHGVPEGCHGGDVINHVTLRLFFTAEVGHHLAGLHDDLPQQQGAGANHRTAQPQQPYQVMHLRQIPAGGSQLLPYVGRGIQADHIHPLIAQEQHVRGHLPQDGGVCVV